MPIELKRVSDHLVTIRSVGPLSLEDAHGLGKQLTALFFAGHKGFCACVDLRHCGVVSAPVADFFLDMLRRDNPMIHRSAFLVYRGDLTLGMQVHRLLREAGNPQRRSFQDGDSLLAWLDPELNDKDRAALAGFLKRRT